MLALLLVLTQSPVTVQLNHDQFTSGDRARVYVQSAQDGYLIVLHADPEGRIRVLFPLDPSDDDFIRGDKRFEVRGRADRDAFQIESDEGSGTVLAAVANDPFRFDNFVRNDHWDFRALGGPSSSVRDDPLAKLVDIVQRMAGDSTGAGAGRFEYDAATYVVNGSRVASRYGSAYGWGYPHYNGAGFYNPFCFDPFWGWASCFGYGFGYGFGYPYGYRFGFGFAWRFPYTRYRPFTPLVFTRKAPLVRYEPVPVRPRSPVRTRDFAPRPRIFSRPQPRASGGWSRPSISRGGGSGRSVGGGGGGRRH